jgi:hypothetical protein
VNKNATICFNSNFEVFSQEVENATDWSSNGEWITKKGGIMKIRTYTVAAPLSFILGIALSNCGKKAEADDTPTKTVTSTSPSDKATDKNTEAQEQTPAFGTLALTIDAVGGAAAALNLTTAESRSFSPESYKIPIQTIYASEQTSAAIGTASGSGKTLYECKSTVEAECAIDLLDPVAMAAAIGKTVEIPVGSYKSIGYSFACGTVAAETNSNLTGIHVAVKGTVVIGGVTYYTSSGAEVLTTDIANYGHATLAIGGCGGKVYNLDEDLVVEDGKEYKMSLLLSTNALAWGSLTGGASNPAGCVFQGTGSAITNGICTNLPAIIPVTGDLKVLTESYVVESAAYCGGAIMTFAVNSATTEALGVFLSRYYSDTVPAGPGSCWDAGVDLFKKNADGSYTVGSDTTAPGAIPRVRFNAFTRDSHTGTLDHDQNQALVEGAAYTSVKQD